MTEQADAKAAMDAFKHKSGLWLHAHRPAFAWKGDYYDHIVRRGDGWRRQAFYVYNNPVRKGLVLDAAAWPHADAIGFDLVEVLIDANY